MKMLYKILKYFAIGISFLSLAAVTVSVLLYNLFSGLADWANSKNLK